MLRKIISGGQSGPDQADLDFAIARGPEGGGFVRRGRKAEDGGIADRYNPIELNDDLVSFPWSGNGSSEIYWRKKSSFEGR
jgi:hypothetical protein